jgi:hypothetical protein
MLTDAGLAAPISDTGAAMSRSDDGRLTRRRSTKGDDWLREVVEARLWLVDEDVTAETAVDGAAAGEVSPTHRAT